MFRTLLKMVEITVKSSYPKFQNLVSKRNLGQRGKISGQRFGNDLDKMGFSLEKTAQHAFEIRSDRIYFTVVIE